MFVNILRCFYLLVFVNILRCLHLLVFMNFPQCLDSSRPWLCYWNLHSLQILGIRLEDEEYEKIVGFLERCQSPRGGYGGGPGQHPHLAPTYAAVSALCIIGTSEAYRSIDR